MPGTARYRFQYLIALLAAIVLFWHLGNRNLQDWDEGIYAQIAREIAQKGDWLTLHWNGEPWFEKPPLFMWITAAFFRLFEVNEFWSRATSTLSGVGLVWVSYRIAARQSGEATGVAASLILLTSLQFVEAARFGTIDVFLALFLYFALWAFLKVLEGNPKYWYAVSVSVALAGMAKGAAMVVIFPAVFISLVLGRKLGETVRCGHFWAAAAIALVILLPWHLAMALMHGQHFLDVYIGRHVMWRSLHTMDGHSGGVLYYPRKLLIGFTPWVYLVPFALLAVLVECRRQIFGRINLAAPTDKLVLLVFAMVVFGFYTLVQTKLRWYVLPAFPALAILIADMFTTAVKSNLVIHKTIRLAFCATLFLVLLGWGFAQTNPLFESRTSSIADIAKSTGKDEGREALLVYHMDHPAIRYYSDRSINFVDDSQALDRLLPGDGSRDILFLNADLADLKRDYQVRVIRDGDPVSYGRFARLDRR